MDRRGSRARRTAVALLVAAATMAAAPSAQAVLPSGNVVQNPGAETGPRVNDSGNVAPPPSWQASPNATQVTYGSQGGFPSAPAGAGAGFFAGGPQNQVNGNSDMLQVVDLTAAAPEISGGRVRATLSALLGGFGTQNDGATVTVNWASSTGENAIVGTPVALGPVTAADRANQTGLLPRTTNVLIPAAARYAYVTVDFKREVAQGYNDGYADSVSLTLREDPTVRTLGADPVATSSARVFGSIDGHGLSVPYRVEYGPTTAYGSRTSDQTLPAGPAAANVEATVGGLTPDTDYHARLVAVGPGGPVAGEDIPFHTARPAALAGLPPGLDFTWSPRAEVQIAGAPVGGLQFQATQADGVAYAWDFDFHAPDGFRPDPTATTAAPRRAFSADGAHDTDRVVGADGKRRRVYSVLLRATAPNGAQGAVVHDLVVTPDSPPKVDFTMDRTDNGVAHPVTFTPAVSDPDQDARIADHIDHLEWSFDALAGPGRVDLVCAPDGSSCRTPAGAAPGSWFGAGTGGQAVVNFFDRGLAAHGLPPAAAIDLDALPVNGPGGTPLTGGIGVAKFTGGRPTAYIRHDLRATYLYDYATLLAQSSFNLDAGEATGALLRGSASTRQAITPIKGKAFSFDKYLLASRLTARQVTLTAVDTAGARTSVTHSVPLNPDAAPKLDARFVNRDRQGATRQVFTPVKLRVRTPGARKADTVTDAIEKPLTTADELVFDASSSSDPDGHIAYYTLEVGQPVDGSTGAGRTAQNICFFKDPTQVPIGGAISIDPPEPGYDAGQFFGGVNPAAAGPGRLFGPAGDLAAKGPNAKGLQQGASFGRALRAGRVLPDLGTMLAQHPVPHVCADYAARNVLPEVFKVKASAAARPAPLATPVRPGFGRSAKAGAAASPFVPFAPAKAKTINPALLAHGTGLDFDTLALVTTDPDQLRFRIPVASPKDRPYSVTVAAYDDNGVGAVQRTDGFEIVNTTGKCDDVTGQTVRLAGKPVVFSGKCMEISGNHDHYATSGQIDINGVVLRADGGKLHIDLGAPGKDGLLFATAKVSVLVDGDPIGRFDTFTGKDAGDFVTNQLDPKLIPAATYKGSPVAQPTSDPGSVHDAFAVTFTSGGNSSTHFRIVLPSEFGQTGPDSSPAKDVVRPGYDEPRSTILTTDRFADIARKRHARNRAHAAAVRLNGSLDLSNTMLGPVSIKEGKLTFDSASGFFKGEITDATLQVGPNPVDVKFNILIAGGKLRELGGSATTESGIPIFAGVTLNALRFSIVTDPLTVSGGAGFKFADLIDGNLDLTVRISPIFLRLQGSLGIKGVQLGSAYVQYDQAAGDTLTFGGQFGKDFGPVSLEATLNGGISFASPPEFFIQGGGHACLFICLDVNALVSSDAVAACGSIKLVFVTVAAGFAYRFKGGLSVFSGCDLDPFRPAVFRTRAGGDGSTGGTLTVAHDTQQAAFRFKGDPGLGGSPKVTLRSPDGRVFSTADGTGDYVFSPPGDVSLSGAGTAQSASALVDQDPVDHVTSFLVAKPAAGDWTVQLAPGQPPLVGSEVATGRTVADKELEAPVKPVTTTETALKIDGKTVPVAGAAAAKKVPALVKALRAEPAIERKRTRGAVINVPKDLTGELTLIDAGQHSTTILGHYDLAKVGGKLPVAFVPSTEPGTHELRAFLTHADGTPRDQIVVGSYASPAVPTPTAPKLRVVRTHAGTAYLDVTPGSAGPVSDPQSSFQLVAATSSGARTELTVDGRSAKKLSGGRFRVQLGEVSPEVKLQVSGRMLYGRALGATSTATSKALRRRRRA